MMLKHGRIALAAAVVAACAVGCFGPAAPTPTPTVDIQPIVAAAIATAFAPTPTPTPDVQSMVTAVATPAPTYTPRPTRPTLRPIVIPTLMPTFLPTPIVLPSPIPAMPPAIPITITAPNVGVVLLTPTPVPERLEAVECNPPDCIRDYEPPWDYVDWQSGPRVSANGVISLAARIDERVELVVPGKGHTRNNITLTDGSNELYGSIVPPSGPGWDWTPKPGLWIASEYRYSNRTLTVRAQIDPAAANHPGLRLCLWSGGTRDETQLLDCVSVQQP